MQFVLNFMHLAGDTNSDQDCDPTGIFEPIEKYVVLEGKMEQLLIPDFYEAFIYHNFSSTE